MRKKEHGSVTRTKKIITLYLYNYFSVIKYQTFLFLFFFLKNNVLIKTKGNS